MRATALLCTLSVWLIAFCAGCRDGTPAGNGPHGDPSDGVPALTLLVSGDTAGWIVPCGCTANQSGGMLRRGTLWRELADSGQVVYVDTGGAVRGVSRYDRLKFEAILRGEAAMQVAAHNVGLAEARLGAAYLRETAARLGVPLLTCNVRDSQGQLLGNPLRVVNAAGRKIALVGVLSDSYSFASLRVDPPRQAILTALADSPSAYDSLVVLAYLPEPELLDFAANLPEADLVIGGPTGQSITPRRVGPTWVASATNKGKFLALFEASETKGNIWQGAVREVTAQWDDDPRQQANLATFYATLADHDLPPEDTSFAPSLPAELPASYRVAGTDRCRACHAEDCATWTNTGHARAWKSLTQTGAHVDAYCQQCHTTGFGMPGGFVSASRGAAHVGVGCESCHGPSLGHGNDTKITTTFSGQARHQCVRCHDRENSPHFEYAAYWAKVKHGMNKE